MKLSYLIKDLGMCLKDTVCKEGLDNVDIQSISMDSREKQTNGLFICISGAKIDAHLFVEQAVQNGAVALVVERVLEHVTVPQILVRSSREAMSLLAATFYDYPAKSMKLFGITGTKGKTTTSYLLKAIMEEAGYKVGLIGTTGNMIGDKYIKSNLTTPEAIELHKTFKQMKDEHVDVVIMEVSAHALDMHRLTGVHFETGCYTNLSQDHLDYFNTMDSYFEAKKTFFVPAFLDNAVINIDDETSARILKDIRVPHITYGICRNADVFARDIEITEEGVQFTLSVVNVDEYKIHLKLPGMFNIYNALAAASMALNFGVAKEKIASALDKVKAVPGRAEVLDTNTPYKVILDYSHSPEALKNILEAMRFFTKGRLIVLFGCGGDRDHTKRPIMGKIAGMLADYTILTSDNPRTEDPNDILMSIKKGIEETIGEHVVIENRRQAILHALQSAQEGDVVILAGKGHETYQEINGVKKPFDEKVVVRELLEEICNE